MTTKDTGGSAFPRIAGLEPMADGRTGVVSTGGMTLRDFFAAKALPGCYDEYFAGLRGNEYPCEPGWADGIAAEAYRIADAMLAARKEES